MMTPMITNLKNLRSSKSSLVDPTCHKKNIGSLMYLVNIRPGTCYSVNQLSETMVNSTKLYWKEQSMYRGTSEVQWSMGYGIGGM